MERINTKQTIKVFEATVMLELGFPCSSNGKESACEAGDQGSIPGLGCSSGERNGIPIHYSCLESSMYREAWWATVHVVTKSQLGD